MLALKRNIAHTGWLANLRRIWVSLQSISGPKINQEFGSAEWPVLAGPATPGQQRDLAP